MKYIAAIDVGSLTVRLAVAEATGPGCFRVVRQRREITRLGEGVQRTGALAPAAVSRTLAALAGFARDLQALKVARGRGVATQAVRQAANGPEFLRLAAKALGLPLDLIPPAEEARLTLKGVLSALEPGWLNRGPVVVFDVGGGSAEFVLLESQEPPFFAGVPWGVVSLSEELPLADPPRPAEVTAMQEEVARRLKIFYKEYFMARLPGPVILVGTAGAVTTLAAMAQKMTHYEAGRVNNFRLSRRCLEELLHTMVALPLAQRARLPGLEPAKAGVMVAGAMVVSQILAVFRQDFLITIDAGLLEGILAEMAGEPGEADTSGA